MCEEVEGECMYCHLVTSPIIKHIKKHDEDFWNENNLKGLTFYGWQSKEKNGAEIIHF